MKGEAGLLAARADGRRYRPEFAARRTVGRRPPPAQSGLSFYATSAVMIGEDADRPRLLPESGGQDQAVGPRGPVRHLGQHVDDAMWTPEVGPDQSRQPCDGERLGARFEDGVRKIGLRQELVRLSDGPGLVL